MKVRAPNIRPFAAIGHFSLYYRPFFSLSSYETRVYFTLVHRYDFITER